MPYRRIILAMLGLVVALGALEFGNAAIAQEKSAKELVVGTWTLTIADHIRADGSKVPGFGPLPTGTATFSADGKYSLQISSNRQPALASAPATVGGGQGAVSQSGTYAIDEAQRTLTLRIEQSSLPNRGGTTETAMIKFLVANDLAWTAPKALTSDTGFVGTELIWRRAK